MIKPFTAPSLSSTLPIPCAFLYLILLLLYSLIILVLLQDRNEMTVFPKAFPILALLILYLLPKETFSLSWHQLPQLCNCCFKLCL